MLYKLTKSLTLPFRHMKKIVCDLQAIRDPILTILWRGFSIFLSRTILELATIKKVHFIVGMRGLKKKALRRFWSQRNPDVQKIMDEVTKPSSPLNPEYFVSRSVL